MKTSILYLIMGLLVINSLNAQVKIGDNPQNLDPASLLELQSNNRVLVITRVTDAQMGSINPLQGALVYNTDQECLHYYDGTEWINICEELDNSFTVSTRPDYFSTINPAQSKDSTVVISQTVNADGSINYNYEVGLIRGANIVNTTINGDSKLQDESVTNRKLADEAVALDNLEGANNAGDLFMYTGSAWNYVNRSDLLNTQLDSIVGNEVVGPSDTTLERFGNGVIGDPYTLDVSEGGITDYEIATDAVTTDEILNQTILEEDIADDAVTNAKMADNSVGTDEIIDDSVGVDEINSNIAGDGLVQNASGALDVDVASLTGDGDIISTGLDVTGGANSAFNDVTIEIAAGAVGSSELAADAVTTDKIATGAVESTDIAADAVNAATINLDVA
ncbi:hypothetical protein, partial [Flagellimonas oceanensis]|uniref:hypothetical protein n=1 Tax=Flagellimonas oceanensis TaxID=2499163 RepID=UPI00197BDCA4